jgi:Ca2+-binding RTX toxin-like protein
MCGAGCEAVALFLTATVAAGSFGSSFLNGGEGNDQLTVFGGSANILHGGDGRDTLIGGTGNDTMFGDAGADTFTFAGQIGHDTIHFEQGRDTIDLTAFAANNIDEFADLNIEVAGSNSIVHFDENNSMTIVGVNDLSAGDFWFA